jgi:4-amino-4-deoxy-L-arabinose transferase-like glycosyltransferase
MTIAFKQKKILVIGVLLLAAFSIRVAIVRILPSDAPQDGLIYDQTARNLVERQVYSQDSGPPYAPSLRRMPGYPLLLAGVYSIFGYDKTAVRLVQALMDTATCAMIGMLAYFWEPDKRRRQASASAALALAAFCPFTAVYTATILTETPTMFFAVAMSLAATLALRATIQRTILSWWIVSGLLAGVAVLFRPDNGLFVSAIGITLLVATLARVSDEKLNGKPILNHAARTAAAAAVFSLSAFLMLLPWTIRNYRQFHVLQPLSPAHGEMLGEFLPRGYLTWVRTWIDDGRYVGAVIFSLDAAPISLASIPESAFDSAEERLKVGELFAKYNHSDASRVTVNENDAGPTQSVKLTPEIDAGFAELAHERISRHPFRYYVWLPLRRARSLWFDTHSQYYPFQGELFPLKDLNARTRQEIFLPLFAAATWVYTLLGIAGGWFLWQTSQRNTGVWVLLAALMIFLRLGFFAAIERPEPRYVVEVFPFLSILGGVALVKLGSLWSRFGGTSLVRIAKRPTRYHEVVLTSCHQEDRRIDANSLLSRSR